MATYDPQANNISAFWQKALNAQHTSNGHYHPKDLADLQARLQSFTEKERVGIAVELGFELNRRLNIAKDRIGALERECAMLRGREILDSKGQPMHYVVTPWVEQVLQNNAKMERRLRDVPWGAIAIVTSELDEIVAGRNVQLTGMMGKIHAWLLEEATDGNINLADEIAEAKK